MTTTVLYSFNKRSYEAKVWESEIASAGDARVRFVPFNHDRYLDPGRYVRAQLLDNLYYANDPGLGRMYRDLLAAMVAERADVLVVDTCPPYHPEFLLGLPAYKVLRIADGPLSAYDRDFAYLHAYDHVLYHSPAYSRDLGMKEKLRYCGAKRADLWPLAAFDGFRHPGVGEDELFSGERDVDVVFVGALHPNKMPLIARVKKAFGRRMRLHGLGGWKKNLYFNAVHGFPGWVRPIPSDSFAALYRRTKIGINLHNRGKYTVGNYRMFDLPANGAMQISDGGEYLGAFFEPGEEIVGFDGADDLVDKVRFYLEHGAERERIARNGHRRVLRDHTFRERMRQAGEMILRGMAGAGTGAAT